MPDPMPDSLDQRLDHIARHALRAKFHLRGRERAPGSSGNAVQLGQIVPGKGQRGTAAAPQRRQHATLHQAARNRQRSGDPGSGRARQNTIHEVTVIDVSENNMLGDYLRPAASPSHLGHIPA